LFTISTGNRVCIVTYPVEMSTMFYPVCRLLSVGYSYFQGRLLKMFLLFDTSRLQLSRDGINVKAFCLEF